MCIRFVAKLVFSLEGGNIFIILIINSRRKFANNLGNNEAILCLILNYTIIMVQ